MYFKNCSSDLSAREVWEDYLNESLPDSEGILDRDYRRNIVKGLAAYLGNGRNCSAVRSELLPPIFIRALAKVQDEKSAGECLQRSCEGLEKGGNLAFLQECSQSLRDIIAMGWLRPIPFYFGSGRQNWILRMGSVSARFERGLELALFTQLRHILDLTVEIWDFADGSGVLAFSGLPVLVERIHGDSANSVRQSQIVGELRDYCKDYFAKAKCRRGWNQAPQIVVRDLV